MAKNNSSVFLNIHNFYKIKLKMHFVAVSFYVLIFILSIILIVMFVNSYQDFSYVDLEIIPDTLPSSASTLITLLTICGIIGGALSFANAILGIVGYTKFDALPLITINESLRTKALVSLILGWTFPLGAFVVDWILVKNISKASINGMDEEENSRSI